MNDTRRPYGRAHCPSEPRQGTTAAGQAHRLVAAGLDDLPLLQFTHLSRQAGLAHGITTREGGVSRPPHDRLNLSFAGTDAAEAVSANRRRLRAALGAGRLVFLRQVHGATVLPLRNTPPEGGGPVGTADAVVTNQAGLMLTILVADCQAVLLFDPRRRVAANVHSGWRGSIVDIIGATLAVMVDDYGCRPADILAGVGPSLGPCCAEFVNYRKEIPESLWNYRVNANHFDFWALSHDQLTAAGVASANIRLAGICTRCHSDRYFSYRAGHQTGRFAAVIGMLPG